MEYLLGEGPQPGSYALAQPGGYPGLRGMMTWSMNWDAAGSCDGTYTFAENFTRIFGALSTGVGSPGPQELPVFPDPVANTLDLPGPGVFRILDATGRTVRTITVRDARSMVDVSGLASGLHILCGTLGSRPVMGRFITY